MCPPPIFVMQSVPRAKSRIREIFKKSVRVVKRLTLVKPGHT